MPEIVTKYPDIVLQILSETGAECGTGAVQKILTAYPSERFCSLPTEEICVYGLNEIPQMTQISTEKKIKEYRRGKKASWLESLRARQSSTLCEMAMQQQLRMVCDS